MSDTHRHSPPSFQKLPSTLVMVAISAIRSLHTIFFNVLTVHTMLSFLKARLWPSSSSCSSLLIKLILKGNGF